MSSKPPTTGQPITVRADHGSDAGRARHAAFGRYDDSGVSVLEDFDAPMALYDDAGVDLTQSDMMLAMTPWERLRFLYETATSLGRLMHDATPTPSFEVSELSEAAQRSLQAMKPFNYEYQSDFARKYFFEGSAALLVKLLQLKFGPLSDDDAARVHSASSKELDAWAERILSAASLDEVFR
jgi:hypothetical protein